MKSPLFSLLPAAVLFAAGVGTGFLLFHRAEVPFAKGAGAASPEASVSVPATGAPSSAAKQTPAPADDLPGALAVPRGDGAAREALLTAARMPAGPERDLWLQTLLDGRGLGVLLDLFEALPPETDPAVRRQVAGALLRVWMREDVAAAARWLARQPTPLLATWSDLISAEWARQAPAEAVGWAWSLPGGEARARAVTAAAEVWAASDPALASAWLNQFEPHPDLDGAVVVLTEAALAGGEVEAALSWAESIVQAPLRYEEVERIVRFWASVDTDGAAQYLLDTGILPPPRMNALLGEWYGTFAPGDELPPAEIPAGSESP